MGIDTRLARADLVLTGEGAVDRSTAFGKTPARLAERARAYGRPGNRQVYAREDLVTRWVRLWSEGHWQITCR